MILEFRTESGTHKFELRGAIAETTYSHLNSDPMVWKKKIAKFKDNVKKEFIVFYVNETQGYKIINEMVEFIIQPGEYVKIIP